MATTTSNNPSCSKDLRALLNGEDRDYLVQSNGEQVKTSNLDNKILILHFAPTLTPSDDGEDDEDGKDFMITLLGGVRKELIASNHDDVEMVLIAETKDEEAFGSIFPSIVPWLAVPFSDQQGRDRLFEAFEVEKGGFDKIVFLGKDGEVSKLDGLMTLFSYGADSYPFTEERIKMIEEEIKAKKENQTLKSLLVSKSRDFLIRNNGSKVPVSELEGKMVGLLFSRKESKSGCRFDRVLTEIYNKLKENGESFEVVFVTMDTDSEEKFVTEFNSMPWLAIPHQDNRALLELISYFELSAIPTLSIIGPDGKTLNTNVARYINLYGIDAYPFSSEKLSAFHEIEKAKHESQTLESLLVSNELDYVLAKDGSKVPVSSLVGKTVLIYFSRKACPPCRAFTPKLAEAYNQLKANKHDDFEVIFVSLDNDHKSFEEYYSKMPWLVLPYDDHRETYLNSMMRSAGIPHLVVLGPNGRTGIKQAVELVEFLGADAYPFDENKMKEMESKQKSKDEWVCEGDACYRS